MNINANLANKYSNHLDKSLLPFCCIKEIFRKKFAYVSELCVAPKYLSEICKQVSGCNANYWINRFTILDISRLLRDKQLDFVEIADIFSFSSASYFTRYVQRYLCESPSEYRG